MKRYRLWGLALACLWSLLAVGFATGGHSSGKPLTIVGDKAYAPFEFTGPDGEPRGILVDYWEEWSKETGIPIRYRLVSWLEATKMLESGEANAVSGLFRTPERASQFDFGRPFCKVEAGIFYHDSLLGVRTLDDLQGFEVGVVQGDYAVEYLAGHAPGLKTTLFKDYEALVRAALRNQIQVFVGDRPVIRFLLARYSDGQNFRMASEPLYTENLQPAVRKGDGVTLALLDGYSGVVPSERMERIVEAWTGSAPWSAIPWIWLMGAALLFVLAVLLILFRHYRLLRRIGWTSESLTRSEERYQLAVLGSNDGIWDWDRDTDAVYYSPRWKSIIGYEDHELPNRIEEWKSRIHPEDFDRVMEANQSLFDTNAQFFEVEYRLRHKDGSWRWVCGRGTCLRDAQGAVRRMAGVHSDQTTRRRMEDSLRRSEESLREILDNMMDGFYRTDMSGRVIMANPRMREMLGYGPDEQPEGKEYASDFYLNPEQRQPALEKIMAEGAVAAYAVTLQHRDGSPVEVESNSRLIRDPNTGEPVGIEGVVRDVSERRRHESELQRLIARLEAKNEELERFTYTVSHDLKSPIITIKGFLGLLERDFQRGDRERIQNDFQRINSAADKMELLLRELLELSRIGRMDNPLVRVSLAEIAREALELSQGLLGESEYLIQGVETLPEVLCDRPRMVQVFLNLFSNAVKFRAPGIPLVIQIRSSVQRDAVEVRVEDNGSGINPAYLETIFGLFQQLDQNREGSGLGLALVRRIIENHGGRIWAESQGLGKGTAFVFTLPHSAFSKP